MSSCRRSLLLFFVLVAAVNTVRPTDTYGNDDQLLVLDTSICQGDMRTIGECLNRQNENADRWLEAIVESYAKLAAAFMSAPGENMTYDLVAQLRQSQRLFE